MKNKIIVSLLLIFLIAISVSAVSANEDLSDAISDTSDIDSELELNNEYEANIDSVNELNEDSDDRKLGSGEVNIGGNPANINNDEGLKYLRDGPNYNYGDGQVFELNDDYTFNFTEPITIKKSYIIEGGKIRGNVENFFIVESPANGGPGYVTIRNTIFFMTQPNQTILLTKGVTQGINSVLNVAGVTLENITIGIANQGATLLNIECDPINTVTSGSINITNNNLNGIKALKFNGIQMTHGGLDGEEIYLPGNEIIFPKNTILFASDWTTTAVDKSVGDVGKYYQVTLKDEYGNPVVNRNIKIVFGLITYDVITNDQGVAKLQINNSKAGEIFTYVQFEGDDYYKGSSMVPATITINKKASVLTVKNAAYKVTATKKLSAIFKDGKGKLIKNKKVTFTVNGKSYSATTNSKGVATVKISLNKKGKYTYKAKFAGDSTYKAVTKSATLTITPLATGLTLKKYTYKKASKSKKLKATLKSGTKVLKNKKVSFKVNGKTYSAKTNSKGIATVTIKLTKKGTFKYTAKFAGDNVYKAISKSNKVVIK